MLSSAGAAQYHHPHVSSTSTAHTIQKVKLAHEALLNLEPFLEACPGHWWRQGASVEQLHPRTFDVGYLSACFDAVLVFYEAASLCGFSSRDMGEAYHELREYDLGYQNMSMAIFNKPFAAALALNEFVDSSTYFLKMVRDCIDIECSPPWKGDPWTEMGLERRQECLAWFEKYNSRLPITGSGEWRSAIRGSLAEQQALAWGQMTVEEMERRLSMDTRSGDSKPLGGPEVPDQHPKDNKQNTRQNWGKRALGVMNRHAGLRKETESRETLAMSRLKQKASLLSLNFRDQKVGQAQMSPKKPQPLSVTSKNKARFTNTQNSDPKSVPNICGVQDRVLRTGTDKSKAPSSIGVPSLHHGVELQKSR